MAHKKQLRSNRNYKDTVFRMLFSDRKNLLSLYNAVSGAHYEDPEMLEIVTLENAIYMGMKNDLAFIIDTDLFQYAFELVLWYRQFYPLSHKTPLNILSKVGKKNLHTHIRLLLS